MPMLRRSSQKFRRVYCICLISSNNIPSDLASGVTVNSLKEIDYAN